MKQFRLAVILCCIAAAIGLGVLVSIKGPPPKAPAAEGALQIGGDFKLVDQDGKPVDQGMLKGKWSAVFFGFTYCPEVCPTTLTAITQWLDLLGRDADRLNVVFVSLDPERDTPEVLKAYLSNFDPRIRGLTGSVAEVAATAKVYRVFYKKVPTGDGSYTIDHSTAVYLFDSRGRFVAPIAYGEASDSAVPRLKTLIHLSFSVWQSVAHGDVKITKKFITGVHQCRQLQVVEACT
jgi:protein SCO1/2